VILNSLISEGNKLIRKLKEKLIIFIGLKFIAFLIFLKRIFYFFILLIFRIFKFIYSVFLEGLIFFFYKIYLFFKKLLLEHYQKEFFQKYNKNLESFHKKLIYLIFSRTKVHFLIIFFTLFVAVNNIWAKDQGQNLFIKKTIFTNIFGREEVIQEDIIPFFNKVDKTGLSNFDKDNSLNKNGGGSFIVQEKGAIVQPNILFTSPPPRTEIVYYRVKSGDTVSSIAKKFGLSTKTILWANKLSSRSIIRPGQKLVILPEDGLIHKVKRGETLEKIAKQYQVKTEKIIQANDLADASKIKIGTTLFIPGGTMPHYSSRSSSVLGYIRKIFYSPSKKKGGHRFPWGQCTWYVAQKRYVPWGGHAKYWLVNAQRYGYQIGRKPKVGAIIVLRESWYGHVAYVEKVGKNTVTFSEMNHRGLGVITRRTLRQSDRRIIGYIY